MNVGILGLGLIGGSLARAYTKAGHKVFVHDTDSCMLEFAQLAGAVYGPMDESNIRSCELILLAIYADASATWLETNAHLISKDTFVIDCCGIKKEICDRCFPLAQTYGFTFIGGHPMAGSHFSGFKYSRSNMFQGAPMVLVPPRYDDPIMLEQVKTMLAPCGFGSYSVTTAEAHDTMIAFTSQMPHIISNAFIKSPTANDHKGFSAGSYKDMTRVAWLNPEMWAELFLSNKENVLKELSFFIENLKEYQTAIEENDSSRLIQLLDDGKKCKEAIDK